MGREPLVTATLLSLCSSLSVASAQTSANGSIRGYVMDEQKAAVAGVTLTASNSSAPGTHVAVTDPEGFYRLPELPPGSYSLTAELQGFARHVREGIAVRAGLNLSADMTLKLGAVTESVDVQAETPLLETQTAVQAANLSGDLVRGLPLSASRRWDDFLIVTPGVMAATPFSPNPTHQVRGSDFASHVIQTDGADVASASQGATFVINMLPSAIEDVQVKTGAMDAASPLGVGAVISIATKSGTNHLKGSASFDVQDRRWSAGDAAGGTPGALDGVMLGATLGGPLVKDKLWFFTAYRYERSVAGINRTSDQVDLLRALVPGFEAFDRRAGGHLALSKLTGQLSPRHRSEITYQCMPRENRTALPTDAGLFQNTVFGGGLNLGLGVTSSWRPGLTTRFNSGFSNNAERVELIGDKPSRPVHASAFVSGGRLVGSGLLATLDNASPGFATQQNNGRATLSGDVFLLRSGFLGAHELQAGFSLQRNHSEALRRYANGGMSREESVLRDPRNPAAGVVGFWREVWDVGSQQSLLDDSDDMALYLQDAWHPTTRLTLNAGVRLDFIKRKDRIFDLTVQDSTEVGPRLGLNYAFGASRRHLARASWVRVHDVLSTNRASAGTTSTGKTDIYDLDLNGSFETSFVTPGSTARSLNQVFDPARSQPYVDELAAGYRGQLPGNASVDVGFVRREYRNRTAFVETNGIYDGGAFSGYRDVSQNEIYRVTENVWSRHVYDGLELQAAKRTGTLEAVLGYTRAWRRIAGTWQPNDPASLIQPAAFPNDRGIGSVRAAAANASDANSLSGVHMVQENFGWRDHNLNLGLVWKGPFRLVLATTYLFQSGSFGGPVVTRLAAADPRFGPPTLRLSNGRVVPNPLATTIRFAYPTRGEGQNRLPDRHNWNVRLGREIALGAARSLQVAIDVFNVLNGASPGSYFVGANQQYSPNFARTIGVQPPRAARLSASLSF